jgi:hypothetical protein
MHSPREKEYARFLSPSRKPVPNLKSQRRNLKEITNLNFEITKTTRCVPVPRSHLRACTRPPFQICDFRFVIYPRVLRSIGLDGTPTTVTPAGTSLVTTAPAPITASWPMSSGFSSVPLTKTAPVPTLRGNEKDVGN